MEDALTPEVATLTDDSVSVVPSRSLGGGFAAARRGLPFVAAAIVSLIMFFPLIWMAIAAFVDSTQVHRVVFEPAAYTMSNFDAMLRDARFVRYLANSTFVSGTVTVVGLFIAAMAAYSLARLRYRGRDVAFYGIYSTLLVSVPVILVPLFVVVRVLGMTNSYWGLIVPALFHGFAIFLLRQFLLGIPRELEDAARVDGAGYFRVFWSVVVPLARPMLAGLAVLVFLANWNALLWPLTIIQDRDLWVIQMGIASLRGEYFVDWNVMMAASAVAALPMLTLFFVLQKQLLNATKMGGFGGV